MHTHISNMTCVVFAVGRALREEQAMGKMLLHKCDSLPQLLVGETLLQELGIEHTGRLSAMSLNDIQEEEPLHTDRSLPMRVRRRARNTACVRMRASTRLYTRVDIQYPM